MQVEGELVSRKRLEDLAPEQFSSILILADESATFSTADADQASLIRLTPIMWLTHEHAAVVRLLHWQMVCKPAQLFPLQNKVRSVGLLGICGAADGSRAISWSRVQTCHAMPKLELHSRRSGC